jgi:3-phenylpropionate/trans-cinnamate dioxygenase ferredoxin reductase subunit
MAYYHYLIIGGGMTGAAAIQGIRKIDPDGKIGMISNEKHPPYNRPPLSKGLWKGDSTEKIWRKIKAENADIHLSRNAKQIDVKKKEVVDDQGVNYSYDKLLLATGGAARRLPWDVEGLIYFRTLEDYHALRDLAEKGQSFAVIGGGFIGSEIAAALAMNQKNVAMVFPEESIGARAYPKDLSHFLNTYYQSKGVEVLANDGVSRVEKISSAYRVVTNSGKEFKVDGVVAGIGIQPNVELAEAAGLEVDNGIVVDEFLRTSDPHIYAAGDVANFYSPALGKRIRVEHEDNANTMGEAAGVNMAGKSIAYHHLPFFYSDLFDLGYEAVGELDVRHEVVEEWKEKFREGIVYYLEKGRVRGVLLWNTWGKVDAARALIAEKGPFDSSSLIGSLDH